MDEATDWRDAALCAPPDDCQDPAGHLARWFPREYYHGSALTPAAAEAIDVCRKCPSLAPCREYAREQREPDGIWGGETPQDRGRRVRKRWAA